MNLNRYRFFALLILLLGTVSAHAQNDGWPRTVTLDEGLVTVYAPQLEAMDDGVLYYRAALAYRPDADAEPIFGAGWLKSEVDIDEKENIVSPKSMSLTQTRFPDGTTDIEAELATALSRESVTWNLDFTVTELEAALDAAEAETLASQKLKNTPPRIIYRDRPALLVTIDGDPVLREIEDSPYQAVINTPFPLITDGKTYYLNAADKAWYQASRATGPYEFDTKPPQDVVAMVESSKENANNAAETDEAVTPITAANAPEIVVSTEPAELIVTEGPADFVPLVDDLLVLKNSNDDVFMHVGEQKYYIVLAGRWYQSASLDGPWKNQSADDLPQAFAQIPDDSPQADSRVYVAGTPEAQEAILDAQIPQTATVKRGQVDIDVDYDGDPEFERVEGTDDLYYAENTGATVLESGRSYYLLEDGVWYVSNSPHGPWVVSDHRPGELESVEPSSPVYNTKYVYVYDSTPEVVYVGYTPGYVGSYVYGPTLVYGTGYYYRPWISPYYYYPRFRTWGWSVGYSSYGGWSFGIGWNYGGWDLSYYTGGYWHYGRPWYNRYYGYWGPRGYYPRPYYGHNRYAYNPYGRNYGYNRGYRHGYRDGHYDGDYNDNRGRRGRGHRDDYDDRRGDGRGDRRGRDGRQRDRNLYRDDRQAAPIVQTRDTWVRRPDTSSKPAPGQFSRGEQKYAENKKVRQSKTGPVSRTDMRNKAKVRDINRAASREPMVASTSGEVQRAGSRSEVRNRSQVDAGRRVRKDNKIRQSRTEPVSRNELIQRGEVVANQSNRSKTSSSRQIREPSVNQGSKRKNRQAVTEPARRVATTKPGQSQVDKRSRQTTRQVTSPSRKVSSRTVETGTRKSTASPSREVARSTQKNRTTRQVTSPPRVVNRSSNKTSATRRQEPQQRQAQQRARSENVGQVQQNRSAQTSVQQKSRGPSRQVERPPSRPQTRSAPAPRQQAPRQQAPRQQAPRQQAPRQQAPRQQAPRQQAPRQQARSAPKPAQAARSNNKSKSAPRPNKGPDRRRKN